MASLFWLTSILVSNVKESELEKIRFWSEAVKKKAELVRLTNIAFQELSQNETNNVYLWARATKEFQKSLNDFGLALEIIQNNDNIPLILTDNNGVYISHKNIDLLDISDLKKRQDKSDSITLNGHLKTLLLNLIIIKIEHKEYFTLIPQNISNSNLNATH